MSWLNELHEAIIRGALASDSAPSNHGQHPVGISVFYSPRVGALTTQFEDGVTERAQVVLPACVVTLAVEHVRPIFASDSHTLSISTDALPSIPVTTTETFSQTTSMGARDDTDDVLGSSISAQAPFEPHYQRASKRPEFLSPRYPHGGYRAYGREGSPSHNSSGSIQSDSPGGDTKSTTLINTPAFDSADMRGDSVVVFEVPRLLEGRTSNTPMGDGIGRLAQLQLAQGDRRRGGGRIECVAPAQDLAGEIEEDGKSNRVGEICNGYRYS